MNERSGAREQSEQCGASERVSGASERANGQASGSVLTFLGFSNPSWCLCPISAGKNSPERTPFSATPERVAVEFSYSREGEDDGENGSRAKVSF